VEVAVLRPTVLQPTGDQRAELMAWVETFGGHVRRREFDAAAEQFDGAVVSFSSLRDVVVGLPELVEEQWKHVWPSIDGFRFEADKAEAFVSPDGRLAIVAVTWSSTGFDHDGQPFDRPGRATVVLACEPPEPWRGIHAHFSLNRGVPQMSYGGAAGG
jgi:ketosteroid isomerase-like protein